MDQEVPASAGRASFRAERRSIRLNSMHTVTSYAVSSPEKTEGLSADLATSMAAPRTSTEAEAVSCRSLLRVTLAVCSTGQEPAVAALLGEAPPPVYTLLPYTTLFRSLRVPPAMAQVV